ncbi:unnamed protein product [Schistosoma turkestanicum]|nr:unnamed protein product [Schistosoma turkestanicum]
MPNHLIASNKMSSLQLYRVIQLADQYDSQIFSFIVPSQLTKGFIQSVQSKEFYYAGHYWFIRMEYYKETNEYGHGKDDVHFIQYRKQPLGVSINLCNISNGMLCRLKCVRFTIPHQKYYTLNLVHELEDVHFKNSNLSHKKSSWIENGLLTNEHYLFDDSTCILEVELQEAITIYEEQLRVPRDSKEALRCRSLESTTFSFAGDDWSFIIDWNDLHDKSRIHNKNDNRPKCFIQRHSTPKYCSRLKYILHVNWHDSGKSTSGPFDHLVSPESGATTKPYPLGELKWFANSSSPVITAKHRISVKIDFHSVTHISLVNLIPTSPQGGRNCAHLVDPNGIEWILMSDILGTFVHLKLFISQDSNTQYNESELNLEVRSTAWSVQLIPYEQTLNIVKSMSPFNVIYTSVGNTVQTMMKQNFKSQYQEVVLPLDVEKVCSSNFGYSRPSDNAITLRIEWLYSHILCRGDYQNYDELVAIQRYNLLRDINNKDLANERLAKQRTVQLSTSSRENEDNERRLSGSKQLAHLRKSSEILSPPKSYFQDSFMIKATSKQRSISPNNSTYSGNSLTNSPNIKHFLTPSVIINENLNADSNNTDKNYLSINDDLSSNQHWRRHSSCLEDVGTSKPRQRRQLPSPPSSSLKTIGVILPRDASTTSSTVHLNATRESNNNSPRLSLKQEHLDFGYFN